MSDCTENLFCSSLPVATRDKLCTGCHKHLLKAGSLRLYESFDRNVSIILDGFVCGSMFTGEGDLEGMSILPLFMFCLPGRPLSLDVTFFGEEAVGDAPYASNGMVCLTDCCIASIDHDTVRNLFRTDGDFAWHLERATMNLMGDMCQFSALMRSESVYTKVNLIMHKLAENNLYLSRSDIATLLGCNRTSVSRAFSRIESERPDFFARYAANKGRVIELMA